MDHFIFVIAFSTSCTHFNKNRLLILQAESDFICIFKDLLQIYFKRNFSSLSAASIFVQVPSA